MFLLRPIIGEISSDFIVFVLELIRPRQLMIHVTNDQGELIRSSYHSLALGPQRIVIGGLPSGRLTFNWYDYETTNEALLYNQSAILTNSPRSIAFVSCDLPEGDTSQSLWNLLPYDTPNIVCHLGDNIYGDVEYKNAPHNYAARYHKTWKHWDQKLANSSHLMIADDHEITDDWDAATSSGSQASQIGLQAYNDYQESLKAKTGETGLVIKQLESATLILISRIFFDIGPKLRQLKEKMVGDVIIGMSSAPVHFTQSVSSSIYNLVFGSHGWNREQLIDLYDFMFELMDEGRKVVLVGGDIHIGVDARVYHPDGRSFPIYVTGPITNHPTVVESIAAAGLDGTTTVGQYTLNMKAEARRNYLVLELPLTHNPGTLTWNPQTYPKHYLRLISYAIKMIGC